MTELNLTLIMPLIGVIVGGVIGTTSSFFAGYIADKRKHRMELTKLRLQKLEECTCELEEVFDSCVSLMCMTYMKAHRNTELPARTPEFKKALANVNTIISIYFPELRETHQELLQSKGKMAAAVIEMTSVYEGNDPGFDSLTEEQKDKASKYIAEKASDVIDKIKKLESQFHKLSDKLMNA